MTIRRFTVAVTSLANQTATAYSPWLSGFLQSIEYVKDGGANPYANGVDFAITSEATGASLWSEDNVNASTIRYPRAATCSAVGAAALYAGGGTAVQARIGLGRDRVKIVLAQAGATKNGSFVITMSDR